MLASGPLGISEKKKQTSKLKTPKYLDINCNKNSSIKFDLINSLEKTIYLIGKSLSSLAILKLVHQLSSLTCREARQGRSDRPLHSVRGALRAD